LAGLTIVIGLCAWILQGGEPAGAESRAQSDSATIAAMPSFEERFAADRPAPPSRSLRSALSFEDRFGAAASARSLAVRTALAAPSITALALSTEPARNVVAPAVAPRAAAVTPLPRPAPRSAQAAANRAAQDRVASLSDPPLPTAYAPADAATKDSGIVGLLRRLARREPAGNDAAAKDATTKETTKEATKETAKDASPLSDDPGHTAIYDISAHTVYLPSGERLEAHSGLHGYMDDVRSVHLKSRGPTPPNVYELKLRENLFHGVQAIRLNPVDGRKMYGRAGLLAHPFMLGPDGQSNGCVSLKDYPAFLNAYQRGEITRLVVVEQLDDPPSARTAADWLATTLKRLFAGPDHTADAKACADCR
jgi:hypothetical protein